MSRTWPEKSRSRNIRYVETSRWELLGHQLPARSSNARVKTWRRLQHVGAVPARNSVCVLPNTEQCREDFEWIRSPAELARKVKPALDLIGKGTNRPAAPAAAPAAAA